MDESLEDKAIDATIVGVKSPAEAENVFQKRFLTAGAGRIILRPAGRKKPTAFGWFLRPAVR